MHLARCAHAALPIPRGLRYVSDQSPGISRHRCGAGFCYRRPDGRPLRDATQLERIRHLAIPPAYTQVWICPLAHGHLQATGRDARGRKQYRYHARWTSARGGDKYERLLAFGAALSRIRARVAQDLRQPLEHHRPSRTLLLAALVRLLDTTLIRIGNETYARTNGSYGLTTLRNRHARITGSRVQLRFRGKSGITHHLTLDDPRVAQVVRTCQAMPGQELFTFEDDQGVVHSIGSCDVNAYLRQISGAEFSAKDFRTWHASAQALALLAQLQPSSNHRTLPTKTQVNEALAEVARQLGNTVAVCRKSYVHSGLFDVAVREAFPLRLRSVRTVSAAGAHLSQDER
ncbi:MAG TPA: DNA topoisomerase IB, partial [Planctomycetota bacterium]|nr:DNA topoisomerase IB [Planctomycetota bacterium]